MSSPCATVAFKIFAVFCIIAIQGPLVHALGSVYGYPINYCGNKTDQVIESFEEALYFVESNVLEDVKKVRSKTQPRDAFLTYFKGIRLKVPVAKLFSDMVDVQRPEQQNLETNKFRIYCLTEDAPDPVLVYAYQEACTVYEDTEAAYSSDIPNDQGGNVLLCPAFFDLPLFPRPHNECPRIRNNTMENNANLSLNRLGAVVHELAHAHGAVDESTDVEVYYDQDAADLFPSDQLRNAQNYALYAASLHAQCQDFPQPEGTAATQRKLLESGVADYDIQSVVEQNPNAVHGSIDVFSMSKILPVGVSDLPIEPSNGG